MQEYSNSWEEIPTLSCIPKIQVLNLKIFNRIESWRKEQNLMERNRK